MKRVDDYEQEEKASFSLSWNPVCMSVSQVKDVLSPSVVMLLPVLSFPSLLHFFNRALHLHLREKSLFPSLLLEQTLFVYSFSFPHKTHHSPNTEMIDHTHSRDSITSQTMWGRKRMKKRRDFTKEKNLKNFNMRWFTENCETLPKSRSEIFVFLFLQKCFLSATVTVWIPLFSQQLFLSFIELSVSFLLSPQSSWQGRDETVFWVIFLYAWRSESVSLAHLARDFEVF